RKAMLAALLQPVELMKKLEAEGDVTGRLAYTQEFKAAPFGLVWDYYCAKKNAGIGLEWLEDVRKYEKDVLLKR
ncbi:MAG: L-rhamnose isomerase, partial [Oscillospiraceae bacterium]|nr:L-rhamnose isomerase [Oscillospiraceae bacterium]